MRLLFFLFLLFFFELNIVKAIDTKATHAVILDFDTNEILFDKKSNEFTPPASMTKIMTTYIVFDRVKNGNLKFDDEFIVSRKAYKMGGSRMFVEINSKVSVKDLLYGVIVQSGNDASIVLAENISGSEEEFAKLMNEYADELGLVNTNFVNSSGWPHPNHYSTMNDIAYLSKAIIKDFPNMYKIFSKKEFTYNDIKQPNRNLLLNSYKGVDGLKTGYVKNSGFGIVVTCNKDGRRIILSINGLESSKKREEEAIKLFNWAYRDTKHVIIFEKNQIIRDVDVWLGKDKKVSLISGKKLLTTLTFDQEQNIDATLVYNNPLNAPLKRNQQVGKILVNIPNKETIEIPLLSNSDVKKINPIIRIFSAINYLIFGNINVK